MSSKIINTVNIKENMAGVHYSMDNADLSTFFALDVPNGLEFGINLMEFEIGPKFKGIGLIPNDLHFIYYSCGMGLRQGYFIRTNKKDLVIRNWDSSSETLSVNNKLSTEATSQFCTALYSGSLNETIGAYITSEHHIWQNLTKFITDSVLIRADCMAMANTNCNAEINSVTLFPGVEDEEALDAEIRQRIDVLKNNTKSQHPIRIKTHSVTNEKGKLMPNREAVKPYFNDSPRIAHFVDIENLETIFIQTLHKNGNALTKHYIDKTAYLEYLIEHEYANWEHLLGEVQLSFVLFLLIYSYPALKHWQKCIDLICRCKAYMSKNQLFISRFMRVLFYQLKFAPYDFFMEEISKNNFLRNALSNLMSNLYSIDQGASDTVTPVNNNIYGEGDDKEGIMDNGMDGMEWGDSPTETIDNHGLSETTKEVRKRLLLFLRKKFELFQDTSPELNDYRNKLEKLQCRTNNISVSPHNAMKESIVLSPDDRYALTDDMPTVLDSYEQGMYDRMMHIESTCSAENENMVAEVDVMPMISNPVASDPISSVVGWHEIDRHIQESHPNYAQQPLSSPAVEVQFPFQTTPSDNMPNACVFSKNNINPLSQIEKEHFKYGWRYPLLHDIMILYSIAMKESAAHVNSDPNPINLEHVATGNVVCSDSVLPLHETKLDMLMTARLILDEWPIDGRGPSTTEYQQGEEMVATYDQLVKPMSSYTCIVWNALANVHGVVDPVQSEHLLAVWNEANSFIESEGVFV